MFFYFAAKVHVHMAMAVENTSILKLPDRVLVDNTSELCSKMAIPQK